MADGPQRANGVVCGQITSALAILSKYIVRTRAGNVFNPAALAIVATFPLFHAEQSWWGALPEVTPIAQIALGNHRRLHRGSREQDAARPRIPRRLLPALHDGVIRERSCLGLRSVSNTRSTGRSYSALFILTNPPTSPVQYHDQIVFAMIVAIASFAIFEWTGAVDYLLGGRSDWQRVGSLASRAAPSRPYVSERHGVFVREVSPWRAPR